MISKFGANLYWVLPQLYDNYSSCNLNLWGFLFVHYVILLFDMDINVIYVRQRLSTFEGIVWQPWIAIYKQITIDWD